MAESRGYFRVITSILLQIMSWLLRLLFVWTRRPFDNVSRVTYNKIIYIFHGCLSDSAQNDKKATCQKGYWCLYGSCQSAYIPSHDIQKYCAPWWYHSRQAVLHSSTKIAGAWGCQISQQVYSSKIILPLMEKNWPPISSSPCLRQPQRHLHWWQ